MKILFIAQSLKIGGIEKALINQVNELSKNAIVHLFVFSSGGDYRNELSKKVKIFGGNFILRCVSKTQKEARINLLTYLVRSILAVAAKLFGSRFVFCCIFKYTRKFFGYDFAISYFNDQGSHSLCYGCNDFLISNVSAKKKIAWIHSDYTRCGLNTTKNKLLYNKIDVVVNVSLTMKKKFDRLSIVPFKKSAIVYNRINISQILFASNETIEIDSEGLTIVTVGRLEQLKGTIELIDIARKLKEKRYSFKWLFIGDGILYQHVESYIEQFDLSSNIVLLGNLINPYPYIKCADLLVSGSKVETFGLSIVESLIIGTPVISYYYDALGEILSEKNGIICKSYAEILYHIEDLIINKHHLCDLKKMTAPLMDYNELNTTQIQSILCDKK